MSETNQEIINAIASGATSGSVRTDGSWGSAPRLTSNQKVTGPRLIKASHDGEAVQEITTVRGPSAKSVEEGARREAAERAQLLEEEDNRRKAKAETTAERTQARLAFLERSLEKLTKELNKIKKANG